MVTKKKLQLKVGDLVNHILMDDRWLGIVMEIRSFALSDEKVKKALIYILSSHTFSKWHSQESDEKTPARVGWVDYDFLRLIAEGNIKNG